MSRYTIEAPTQVDGVHQKAVEDPKLDAAIASSTTARNRCPTNDGIYSVPPGHYAIAQKGEVSTYPYWDLDFPTARELAADDRSDAEVVAGFREVLEDAMRERLVADVEMASYPCSSTSRSSIPRRRAACGRPTPK